MARVSHEYRIETGEPDERLCSRLAERSANGWEVAGITYGSEGLICLLQREKDFEVARTLQAALEEDEASVEAVSRIEIPPDELRTS
jgi:hypothetical protein